MIIERIIASRDTIIVRNPKGYGSNGSIPGTIPTFIRIQAANQIALIKRKVTLLKVLARSSAKRMKNERDLRAWASKER